ncbi:uncharacterized protein TRIVIDRAFT_65798 [Trichoderma virens Gv29-8]|uniref:Uncharacterized protein n=1 Tax=Hypocrea virens (strain Gv29-8 / FGSC 10586) TaxID=413071 RepID=G9N907_HYPVG|nr:uncharacterized protein TRIVIDRAFT_65798 [Trichoderma virens Gv29-8]EHK16429.1 hypothetical protein TRIVIDRAFT_65798 [Trichoderma virens Gv29-8]UKZ52190.1 hypothetical protein TrVGV298_005965 [Trichoderma virens]
MQVLGSLQDPRTKHLHLHLAAYSPFREWLVAVICLHAASLVYLAHYGVLGPGFAYGASSILTSFSFWINKSRRSTNAFPARQQQLAPPAEFRLVRHMDSRRVQEENDSEATGRQQQQQQQQQQGLPAREDEKKKKRKKEKLNPFADDVLTTQQALSITKIPHCLSTRMATRISTFAEGSLNPGGHERRSRSTVSPRPSPGTPPDPTWP